MQFYLRGINPKVRLVADHNVEVNEENVTVVQVSAQRLAVDNIRFQRRTMP